MKHKTLLLRKAARSVLMVLLLVVAGLSPAFAQSEVPEGAIKMVNGRKLALTPVSVMMVIEGTPEENGIVNYSTFSGTTMDTN